ncbi:hypothetical protein [Spirosoma endophyticum]|uniref:DUF1579 domain-containing protein n=1 Tax=Spirosoma endophyticum TaxID=662367 RepID=A0A1I2DQS8_9BACT|nr:hypothetical protein [Spirosoma endophyticum]SFE82934.1 hypothetical protein SAMN05216167_12031 [Spirosoma endophyticum]
MKKREIQKAQIPNPALKGLANLIGEWKTASTHPAVPNKVLPGTSSFEWIEGGAFLKYYLEVDEKGFPVGIGIFGSDDATGEIFMLFFDERKVSRKYEVSVEDNVVKWWRNAPGFSQRYSWTITDNGNTIIGKGELCEDGETWGNDLDQTFTRVN